MTIAFVQSTAIDLSGTSATATFATANTVGHMIFASARWGNTGATYSCSDNSSNVYSLDVTGTDASGDTLVVFSAPITSVSGGNPITVTFAQTGASATVRAAIDEFSGLASTGGRVNVTATANSGGVETTAVSSGAATTTVANCLLLGATSQNSGLGVPTVGNMGTGSAATLDQTKAFNKFYNQYAIASTTGSYQNNSTLSSADYWGAVFVAYQSATAAVAITPSVGAVSLATGGASKEGFGITPNTARTRHISLPSWRRWLPGGRILCPA
jgi:hypothetical protein